MKSFLVHLIIGSFLARHMAIAGAVLALATCILILVWVAQKMRWWGLADQLEEPGTESAGQDEDGQLLIREIEGVTSDEDLLIDTRRLITGYQQPRDLERIYDRLWHCLRWQQVNQEDGVNDIVRELYLLFAQTAPVDTRWMMYGATKAKVGKGEFSPSCFLNFLWYESDEGIVSTAALDILAYSGLTPDGELRGSQILYDALRCDFSRCPGAVFGGAVSFGDGRQAQSLKAMIPHLYPADIQVAARMQTSFVNHASLQFWIALALANVDGDDAAALSVTGSAASALVLARRGARDPVVAEIERQFPTDPDGPRMKILGQWHFDQYAVWMSDTLYELEAREREPKVFSKVLQEWGLQPRSANSVPWSYQ